MSGLGYCIQNTVTLFGSKNQNTKAITETALTAAYAGNLKTIEVGSYSKIDLAVSYTMGAAETSNSIDIRIEQSPDGTNWYRVPNESVSGGTSTLTAREFVFVGTNAANATISIGLDVFYKHLRVAAKESGVAANAGTFYIEATLSGV